MNILENEQKEAENKYRYLKPSLDDDYDFLLKLNHENVVRIEAQIMSNSIYSEKKIKDSFKAIDNILNNQSNNEIKISNSCNEIEGLIYQAVCDVDNTNSTHINSDTVGRKEITDRILNYKIKDFYDNLENPKDANFNLLKEIARITTYDNEKNIHRYNISFASKFLQSACFHIYEDDRRDNYSKYDNIIKKVLPYYAKRYGVKCEDFNCTKEKYENYEKYYKIIGDIIEKAKISRNGFDHLLWYYHKNNKIENIELENIQPIQK